jgi:ATP-dependent exoDNAse (exonuclease V) beta subunit
MTELPDLDARLRALTDLDSTLLVEAAAGTGKTALLAGRVAVALIRRVTPDYIAAITFSEYAASQLAARINKYVVDLLKGDTPDCLKAVFPAGLTAEERVSLEAGHARIDELTVTTIHGFCQRLIHSYAVEANIDPGARMMDAPSSDAAFRMIFRQWLRDRLTKPQSAIDSIAVMSEDDPLHVEKRLSDLAEFRRRHRTARPVKADLTRRLDTISPRRCASFGSGWHSNLLRPLRCVSQTNSISLRGSTLTASIHCPTSDACGSWQTLLSSDVAMHRP